MVEGKGGRPSKKQITRKKIALAISKKTPEVLKKLEEAFSIGCTTSEACVYADISQATYCNWKKANPSEFERLEAMRDKPIIKARQTIINNLGDTEIAMKYLGKKRREEFGEIPVMPNVTVNNIGESKNVVGFNLIAPKE